MTVNGVIAFFFIAGFLLIIFSIPKMDRRFRTGYRNNAKTNMFMVWGGGACIAIGGLIYALAASLQWFANLLS